jgi:integral membrane protein (TIGR00529 family)
MNTVVLLFIALVTVTVLLALRIPIYIALLTSLLLLSTLSGGLELTVRVFMSTVLATETWFLTISVALIAWLAVLYGSTNAAKILGSELSKTLRSSLLALTIPPGVLGLLPIPGGALMSAPVVDVVGSFAGLRDEAKVFANVWYRHVIVLIYPLTPVLVLTSVISGYTISELVYSLLPIAVVMFLAGLPLVWSNSRVHGEVDTYALVKSLTPILIAAVLAIALSPLEGSYPRLPALVAALISLVSFTSLNKTSRHRLLSALMDKRIIEISSVALIAVAFRTLLKLIDLSDLVNTLGSNALTVCVVLPALLSLVSGYPSAGVVVAIPLATYTVGLTLQAASLIYISAFLAYLVSPVHLCLLYTVQYFKERLLSAYKLLLPLTLGTLLFAYTLYALIG